jgi:ABC-type cobalamin/Fe3+-siderophores transport system ATPase subunit
MNIPLPSEIYGTSTIVIDTIKNVHVIIGPNGSGKSKLMDKLNDTIGNNKVKIIQGNINRINPVSAIDEETTKTESFQNKNIDNVVSLINANETVRSVIFYWFEKLFDKKIFKQGNQYMVTENSDSYRLNVDGDGYKSFFNLIYYLLTPEFSTIVFDEPERHLHPNLQISFFNMIKKLSVDYGKQVYFITHNANFIDLLNDNVEVFILNKKTKAAYNLTSVLNGISNKQFKTWIHYNKHILFSSCVILLEGYSDQILLNHLISKLNNNAFGRNATFCSVAIAKENGGKSRIPEYQGIMNQFFSCWALYDFDLLLDTGGELGKYITEPDLTTFKTALTSNGIANKAQLKTYYNTAGNNVTFLTDMINNLEQNHKVLILTKGEMEDYCQTVVGTSKLTAKIYDEVDHISTEPISVISQEYADIINIIIKVDELSGSNINEFRNLIFNLIMKFYSESYQMSTYDYSLISKDLSNHLTQDPNHVSDNNYRFTFRFLSDIEFVIPKESTEPQKKIEIEQKLTN